MVAAGAAGRVRAAVTALRGGAVSALLLSRLAAALGAALNEKGGRHDPQAEVRRVPPLLKEDRPEDRQATEPRHVRHARASRAARARGAVLQTQALAGR